MLRKREKDAAASAVGQEDWDAHATRLGADLFQSWAWGAFKAEHGWSVERLRVGDQAAQILFRHVGPISLGYIPRGPIFPSEGATDLELLYEIDAACARHGAIELLIDPQRSVPESWLRYRMGFIPAERAVQSPRTVVVDLTLDDDTLLRGMRRDTRYNISYAQRHGITVHESPLTSGALTTFYGLLGATASRSEFGVHEAAYYAEFLEVFGDRATLLFAEMDGRVTAGLIAARYGHEGRSMYAGTSLERDSRGDAALLRLAAMQWARRHGCTQYDLGGIAPLDPSSLPDAETGDAARGLEGVERFKTGFGGEIVQYPAAMRRVYRPHLARVKRHILPH